MITVDSQDVGRHDLATRLSWRADVLSIAIGKVGGDLGGLRSWYGNWSEIQALLSPAFEAHLIRASGLFDSHHYLSANKDVANAKIDPLQHYLQYGGAEGRRPGPDFDGALYLASYADLRTAGLNPLVHYLKYGLVEGRVLGAPVVHPRPVRESDASNEEVLGLFGVPMGGSEQACYAAVLELRARSAALEAEAERMRGLVEQRDHELRGLRSELAAMRSAAQEREAVQEAESERLRRAGDEAELKLYVATASLQRAIARNDELAARVRGGEPQALGALPSAARERENVLEAEAERLRRAGNEAELKLYVATASLQRAVARNDELAAAVRASERAATAPRAELSRVDVERAPPRAAADRPPSPQGGERHDWEASAERDAMQLQAALLEHVAQREREQEAALIASRAEVATLAERVRALHEANELLRAEAPSLATLADAVRLGSSRAGRTDMDPAGSGTLGLASAARRLYLDLLEAVLAGRLTLPGSAAHGGSFPPIPKARLRNLRHLLETVVADGVEGHILDAGARQGAACLYMRAILAAHGVTDRTVWLADSFAGPFPSKEDDGPERGARAYIAGPERGLSLDALREGFERFGLSDGQVAFLPGRFEDTLSRAPIRCLALLRLGGWHDSISDVLEALYPTVAPGGFIVADDVGEDGRAAIEAYRARRNINEPIVAVDGAVVYWRKAK